MNFIAYGLKLGDLKREDLLALLLAGGLFTALFFTTMNSFGLVGEVSTWALPDFSRIVLAVDKGEEVMASPFHDPSGSLSFGKGPHLIISPVRPLFSVIAGGVRFPLLLNEYTGGIADWLPSALYRISRHPFLSFQAPNFVIALLTILFTYSLVSRVSGRGGAFLSVLLLVTDYYFIFYKKVLGNTESLLQLISVLSAFLLATFREKGGHPRLLLLSFLAGLGVHIKFQFGLLLLFFSPLLIHSLPRGGARPRILLSALLLFLLPLSPNITYLLLIHGYGEGSSYRKIESHDYIDFHLEKAGRGITGKRSGTNRGREVSRNLIDFTLSPNNFFSHSAGGERAAINPFNAILYALAIGCLIASSARALLFRGGWLYPLFGAWVFLLILSIHILNRDIHHLALSLPFLPALLGVSLARLFGVIRARGRAWWVAAPALLLPILIFRVRDIVEGDRYLEKTRDPLLTKGRQGILLDYLLERGITSPLFTDYEVVNLLEVISDGEIGPKHYYGLLSLHPKDKDLVLEEMIRNNPGAFYVVIHTGWATIYNAEPDVEKLEEIASLSGLHPVEVEGLFEGERRLFTIYRLDRYEGTVESP